MHARDNPFSNARLHALRYRFEPLRAGATGRGDAIADWEALLARLQEMNFRAAIVGGEGTGKTTLLEDLEPRLRDLDYTPVRLRLTPVAPRFSPVMTQMLESRVTPRHILLFDGSEHFSWLTWQRFRWQHREVGGLIITRARPGRLPTAFRCRTSVSLLEEIVADLMRGRGEVERSMLEKLFARHRGNMRAVLKDLYDRFALGRMKLSGRAPVPTPG